MGSLDITVLIPVRNEAANLARCLDSIVPVRRVLVVDSDSRDETVAMATGRGAEVVSFRWNSHYPRKRQWALDHLGIKTRWVMLLDADESVPPALWEEVRQAISGKSPAAAYLAKKEFHFLGHRMRFGGFHHAAVFLFQAGCAHFEDLLDDVGEGLDMEVHERLVVDGSVVRFRYAICHRDAKGLQAYLDRHNAYASWEAALRYRFLQTGQYGKTAIQPKWNGNTQQRRRFLKLLAIRMPFEPLLWFLYHFIFRGGFLEGRRGWIAAHIRSFYIRQVRARIFEKKLAASESKPSCMSS